MLNEILYTTDVNLEDHASTIFFENENKEIEGYHICRIEKGIYGDDTVIVYSLELFENVSDSFLDEDDLQGFNETNDTNYIFDQKLSLEEQFNFANDLCNYYGANNFENYPPTYTHEEFLELLELKKLIEPTAKDFEKEYNKIIKSTENAYKRPCEFRDTKKVIREIRNDNSITISNLNSMIRVIENKSISEINLNDLNNLLQYAKKANLFLTAIHTGDIERIK